MRKLVYILILMLSASMLQAQKHNTLQYLRTYAYVPSQDCSGYDSTLQQEVRYDRKGRPVETQYFVEGKLNGKSLATYDAKGRLLTGQIQYADRLPTRYFASEYDSKGRLTTCFDGYKPTEMIPVRTYHYEGKFLMRIEEVYRNPVHYRQWVRDAKGNPIREVALYNDEIGEKLMATFSWDPLTQKWLRTSITDNSQYWEVNVCKDANCQQYLVSRAYLGENGRLIALREYDVHGNESRVEIPDEAGKIKLLQCTEYDAYRNITRTWSPLDSISKPKVIERNEYDAQGHIAHQITYNLEGFKQGETYWQYDSLGRIIELDEPGRRGTQIYEYDSRSRISRLTDIAGKDTTRYAYRYDRYDSVAAISLLGGADADGNRPQTELQRYETEVSGRSITRTKYAPNSQSGDWGSLKSYNDGRLMLECIYAAVCWRYQYDAQNRLAEASLYYGNDRTQRKIYNYDAQGRLSSVLTYNSAESTVQGVDYSYPTPGRCILSTRPEMKPKTEYRITYW